MNINETLEGTADLVKNPVFWLLAFLALKETWSGFTSKSHDLTRAIDKNSEETVKLTHALIKLETKFENVEKLSFAIPKIQSDLNVLHSKVKKLDESKA